MRDFSLRSNRNFITLLLAMFIFNFGYSALIPIFPVYFKAQGMTAVMVGFLLSLYAGTKALVHIPSSFVLTKFHKDKLLQFSFLGFGILFVLYYLADKVLSFVIIRFTEGFVAGLSFPVIYALLGSNIPQNKRGAYMGSFTMCSSLGLAMGPLLTGLFIKFSIPTNKIFLIASMLSLLGAALIYTCYRQKAEIFQENRRDSETHAMLVFLKKHGILLFGIGSVAFIGDFIFGSISMSLPMIFDSIYAGNSEYGAFLLSVNFAVFTLFSPFAGKIIDSLGTEKCLNFSMLGICAIFFAIFVLKSQTLFIALLILEFFFASLLFTGNQVKAMEAESQLNASGKIFAVVGTFQSLGFSLGPLLTGASYDAHAKFSFLMISILIGIILLVRMTFIKLYNKNL